MIGATYRDFSGGLVDTVDPTALQPNQSPNLGDVVVDDPVGGLKPRNGFLRCGNTPSGTAATALYAFNKVDGSRRLIVTDNSTIWSTQDCVTFTTIKTGLTSTSRPSFATVRDKLWVVNGSTHPFTWDGVSISTLDARTGTPNPAPPRCRYIEFWKERVWCARTSGDPSSVAFSAIEDTLGNDIDPSTGSAAWPATNAFYIDQDAGSPIYGLKSYRNRLFVFKDGIWEIRFNSEFDNEIAKTFSSVGTRFNESIVELDGILYFVGPDGIYAFDGDQSVRISGEISNKVSSFAQLLVNEQSKTWTSQSDFEAGTLSSASAARVPGSISISSQAALIENGSFETGSISPWVCSSTGSPTCGPFSDPDPLGEGNVVSGVYTARALASCNSPAFGQQLTVFNVSGTTVATYTNGGYAWSASIATFTLDTSAYIGQTVYLHFQAYSAPNYVSLYSPAFVARGNVSFQYATRGCGSYAGFQTLDNFQGFQFFSTGTWISDIYNTVSVSSWSAFDANSTSNGGSVSYFIRAGANTGAVQAASWTPITPGSIPSIALTDIYVQVAATMTANSNLQYSPEIDDVSVSWIQGGAAGQALYAARHSNRLWISASTGSATTNNLVMVKSRAPINSWVPYNMSVGPMVQWNDRFYAAASTHSAIYRMDYGSNDDGRAINWFWESRDESWGQPWYRKNLMELTLDYRKDSATNAQASYSRDNGLTWTDKTVNMSGTGRGSKTLYLNGGNALDYRFRIGSSTIDEQATIIGVTGWASQFRIKE